MPVVQKVTLEILTDSELKKTEQKVIKLEELAQRKDVAARSITLKKTRGSGLFATSQGIEALPSGVLRKRNREAQSGLSGGRLDDSKQKLLGDKISVETEEKFNRTERIMSALGINIKGKQKPTKNSLVSGAGAPIQKSSEFKRLRGKVGKLESNQKALAQSLTGDARSLIRGASGLTTPNGIIGAGFGLASKIPHIAIAITAAKIVADKYIGQFANGGTRDTRLKITDEDLSNIGVENETDITSGRKLFLSNPLKNQGLPTGNSNTQNIRDGIRIYNLRQEGSYQ